MWVSECAPPTETRFGKISIKRASVSSTFIYFFIFCMRILLYVASIVYIPKKMLNLDQTFCSITFLGPKTDLFLIVHLPCFIKYDLVLTILCFVKLKYGVNNKCEMYLDVMLSEIAIRIYRKSWNSTAPCNSTPLFGKFIRRKMKIHLVFGFAEIGSPCSTISGFTVFTFLGDCICRVYILYTVFTVIFLFAHQRSTARGRHNKLNNKLYIATKQLTKNA
jgi:hypothetical protein